MNTTYRLIVLGDMHVSEADLPVWKNEVIPDLNALHPHRIVLLGDLSGSPETGSRAATKRALQVLSGLEVPWASIIGNHDLQSSDFQTDAEAVDFMLKSVGRSQPGWVIEEEEFALLGLDNTQWRRNAVNKNEIVLEDAQLAWWQGELERLGDKPVLIFCHTPPIGSALMVMPELHISVGNAYTNQNFQPHRIMQQVGASPQIVYWFSGHHHHGQHYRDSQSIKLGARFFHTGTASLGNARDGYRHSRIVDIGPEGVKVQTFDHCLRRIDTSLDRPMDPPLKTMVQRRKRLANRRMIPVSPATMHQPSPEAEHDGFRFLFLSDAHSVVPLTPIQRRIARWCTRTVISHMPDIVILGGDITHQAKRDQGMAFMEAMSLPRGETYHILGNNERADFEELNGTRLVSVLHEVQGVPRVWLLSTPDIATLDKGIEALLPHIEKDRHYVVFSHFHPELASEEKLNALKEAPGTIHWICGHRHLPADYVQGQLRVTVCAGLDPIKTQAPTPEILQVDVDENGATIQRLSAPEQYVMSPKKSELFLGFAFRGSGEELLETALAKKARLIQFQYGLSEGAPSSRALELVQQFRAETPGSFLSLHLPNFTHAEEGIDLECMRAPLEYAFACAVDDLTVHPPKVCAAYLFDNEQNFQKSAWAEQCLETYTELAKEVLASGAQFSLENVYNKKVNPPGEEKLGTQPWQLISMVEEIRRRLNERGVAGTERVGIIFDIGHAFSDRQFSKLHGIADWLARIAPYLQISHIHQVEAPTQGVAGGHHRGILTTNGPRINFLGALQAYRDEARRPLPLLLEVRDRDAALASYETLKALTD